MDISNQQEFKTFRVTAKRNDKTFKFNSSQINRDLGSLITSKKKNVKVDLKNFDLNLQIEVRKNNTLIFKKIILGMGGLPIGTSGRTLHLMSTGFDSSVAAIELMKRGLKVDFLFFISPPQTDKKTLDKMDAIIKCLLNYQSEIKLYISNYSELMNLISLTSNQSYKINLMRRSFYRIATTIAKNQKTFVISNGENLGQVASQTIESLFVINQASDFLVLRPLLSHSKIEIINKSKKYGLHDIVIVPANETCELFAPDKPIIKPKISVAKSLEKELDQLLNLEDKIISNLEIKKFTKKQI